MTRQHREAHARLTVELEIHPQVDVETVRQRLIHEVMTLNAELNAASESGAEPDYFVHTRGPHEGQRSDGEHACVPECYEDQSAALENAEYVDPRPQYRVIAEPWYDHDPRSYAHDDTCVTGFSLEVWGRHPEQPPPHGTWTTLGATQTNSGGRLNLDEVHETVIDYVRTLASPHRSGITTDRIEVFRRVTP